MSKLTTSNRDPWFTILCALEVGFLDLSGGAITSICYKTHLYDMMAIALMMTVATNVGFFTLVHKGGSAG